MGNIDLNLVENATELTLSVIERESLTPELLRHAEPSQLLAFQGQLLMGSKWGEWEVASSFIADHDVILGQRAYRMQLALPDGLECNSRAADYIWSELIRYAIARRCFPLRGVGHVQRPWFSTILTEVRSLGMATRRFGVRPGSGFWARCTADEFKSWLSSKGTTYLKTLNGLSRIGAIPDSPAARAKPIGKAPPRHRNGEKESALAEGSNRQFLPLPDKFTAAAGQRALYMVEQVGPTLIEALQVCADTPITLTVEDTRRADVGTSLSKAERKRAIARALDPIIRDWPWRDADGLPLSNLRFEIDFTITRAGEFCWPPESYAEAVACLKILQASHLYLIALADGGRNGEILSLKEGALSRTDSSLPTLTKRTRKVDPNGGRSHEVPVPAAVQSAFRQQVRLCQLFKPPGETSSYLWINITRRRGEPLRSFDGSLKALVSAFRLKPLLEGSNLHMHRFRKTLARLAALSLVHAPKILMDVFGHRDEQMTVMRYILSDPALLLEVQETCRELLVLKGVWVVENLDRMQGKGAERLRERWRQHALLVGTSALEPQSIREFVEVCFEGGQALAMIAPGVMCTSFTRGGRCNEHGGGKPDPEFCSPECSHQIACPSYESADGLELDDAVLNAINTADYLLDQLAGAEERGEPMVSATFEAQIRSMIGRWQELDSHVAAHPHGHRFIPVRLIGS